MSKQSVKITDYDSLKDYLNAIYDQRKTTNPRYSLRSWSKALGYSSHSLLYQSLRGNRIFGLRLTEKIEKNLKLDQYETDYFKILYLIQEEEDSKESEVYKNFLYILKKMKTKGTSPHLLLSAKQLESVSEWHSFGILEMFFLKDFSFNPVEISKKLKNKISSTEILKMLGKLETLGLIFRDPNGKKIRINENIISAAVKPSDIGLKKYFKSVIKLALDYVDEDENSRHLNASTLTIRKSDLPTVKNLLDSLHRDVVDLATKDSDGDFTVQLNTQLLILTE